MGKKRLGGKRGHAVPEGIRLAPRVDEVAAPQPEIGHAAAQALGVLGVRRRVELDLEGNPFPPAFDEEIHLEPELAEAREATQEEAWALFDGAARDELGIDGDEFICRWFGGYYAADPDQPGVIELSMLLPFGKERVQEYLRTHEDTSGAQYVQYVR